MTAQRCTTTSGRYRCDLADGHGGPCETTEPAPHWAGPARAPRYVATVLAVRDAGHEHRTAELRLELRRADRRAANAEARAGMTHVHALQQNVTSANLVELASEPVRAATTLAQDGVSSPGRGESA